MTDARDGNTNANPNAKKSTWSEEHENILIEWADAVMCYRWLHSKSNQKYSG